ncbi:MAG: SMP-30/gluconolactonase/LRE family protein [Pseudomonadota bacterium]
MSTTIKRVRDINCAWGESLCWDERQQRLYFVDCATQKLHWLDGAQPPVCEMQLESLPTGIGLSEDGRVLIALDDGLHLVDVEHVSTELLTPYPEGLGGRANDGTVDSSGSFVTGTLRAEPGQGATWTYASHGGWIKVDNGITNANGHVAIGNGDSHKLIFADSPAQVLWSYPGQSASPGDLYRYGAREVFAHTRELEGFPDGACQTSEGNVLSCILRAGKLALFTEQGLSRTIDAGSEQPSDVTFGGASLDRLFVVSIRVDFGHGQPASRLAGALVEIEGTGLQGAPENRFKL